MLDRRVLTTPGTVAAVVAILTYFNITPISLLKLWAKATKIETLMAAPRCAIGPCKQSHCRGDRSG